jgi:cobalt/nickel transport protein
MRIAPFCRFVAIVALGSATAPGFAHYHILLPEKPSVSRDESVTFTYQFGHPFEHQLFATQKPASVTVLLPEGQAVDLLNKIERVESPGADRNPIPSFRWKFTPTQRGDHVVVVRNNPVWMADEKVFFLDTVKVVLHVQTQNGWDNAQGTGMELVPLTRPYGLRAGMVFQALLYGSADVGSPRVSLRRTLVEFERYNAEPPKELPPDEHVTRAVKTDNNGVATMTLPDPGWWAVTGVRELGMMERAGRNYPVKSRTTHWVHVDGQVTLTPAK